MKAVFALLIGTAAFLRKVEPGCCHQCEYCCMSECADKFNTEVAEKTEDIAVPAAATTLLQTSPASEAAQFTQCLSEKVQCSTEKKWSAERKAATTACLKADRSLPIRTILEGVKKAPSFLQVAECPDASLDSCRMRFPIGAFEKGELTMVSCTEQCLKQHCGCD